MKVENELQKLVEDEKMFYYSKVDKLQADVARRKENYARIIKAMGQLRDPQRRSASILVERPAFMLEISAEFFGQIIVPAIKDDLMEKMRYLSCQLFFAVPLAIIRITWIWGCFQLLCTCRRRCSS